MRDEVEKNILATLNPVPNAVDKVKIMSIAVKA